MESNRSNQEILALKWDKFSKDKDSNICFYTESMFFWKGIKVQIKINCFWENGPIGVRTHYDFYVKNKSFSYKLLDSYMKGTNGVLPSIEFENHKLEILAYPYSLVIYEKVIK